MESIIFFFICSPHINLLSILLLLLLVFIFLPRFNQQCHFELTDQYYLVAKVRLDHWTTYRNRNILGKAFPTCGYHSADSSVDTRKHLVPTSLFLVAQPVAGLYRPNYMLPFLTSFHPFLQPRIPVILWAHSTSSSYLFRGRPAFLFPLVFGRTFFCPIFDIISFACGLILPESIFR